MSDVVVSGKHGSVKTYEWSSGATGDMSPDTDGKIDLRNAEYCTIQLDSTVTGNTCTNADLNLWASMDGSTWDNVSVWDGYTGLGDGEIHSFAVTMGPAFIRPRLDCNNGVSYVRAKVFIGLKK